MTGLDFISHHFTVILLISLFCSENLRFIFKMGSFYDRITDRIWFTDEGGNMKEVIFLKPVFKEMIWGGSRLRSDFGYDIPGDDTGECWAVSAHEKGDCMVAGGSFDGLTLSALWKEHRELFGNVQGDVFPLLVKIIDAKEDLSIQVHPDDAYAAEHENGALGKTECWYILDCDEGAQIVIGHNAQSREELKDMIAQERWDELIRVLPIKKGDFFQIEPGTVHAIKKGTLILETQQSSDITYRLYDYGRLQNGRPRQLHIEQSIDVIRCPHAETKPGETVETFQEGELETLVSCRFYTVKKLTVRGRLKRNQTEPFTIFSVIEGEGFVNAVPVGKGSHFILPAGFGTYEVSGKFTAITSNL